MLLGTLSRRVISRAKSCKLPANGAKQPNLVSCYSPKSYPSCRLVNTIYTKYSSLYRSIQTSAVLNNKKIHGYDEDDEDWTMESGELLPESIEDTIDEPIEQSPKYAVPSNKSDTPKRTVYFIPEGKGIVRYKTVGMTEEGLPILRPAYITEEAPTKLIRQLVPSKRKGKQVHYQPAMLEQLLKDEDLDQVLYIQKSESLDFSHFGAQSSDLPLFLEKLGKIQGLRFPNNKDTIIRAFESVVVDKTIKPIDNAAYRIGHELIELLILNAITSTYPHLPHEATIKITEWAAGSEMLSRALLGLKLEPFLHLVPALPLSKFDDPAATCLSVASNAYISLVGTIHLEHGYDKASEFVHSTLKLERITVDDLRRLKVMESVKDSKITLYKLLKHLYLPLPEYGLQTSHKQPGKAALFEAYVKSGDRILGRGFAQTKILAESRAASEALYNYWGVEK